MIKLEIYLIERARYDKILIYDIGKTKKKKKLNYNIIRKF